MVSFDRSGDRPQDDRPTYVINDELLAKVSPEALSDPRFRDALPGVSRWLIEHIRFDQGGPEPTAWDTSLLRADLSQEDLVMGGGFGIVCRRRVLPLVESMRNAQGISSSAVIRIGALILDLVLEECHSTREHSLEVRAGAQVEICRRMLLLPPRNQRDAAMLVLTVMLDLAASKALGTFEGEQSSSGEVSK